MAIVAYPLNNINYSAEDAMLISLPVSSGVYGEDGNFNITYNGDMTVTISDGLGFIRYAKTKGFTFYMDVAETLTFPPADTVLSRIDRVVLQWDEVKNWVELKVKKGVLSSTPEPPERVETEAVYELVLYDVKIEPNSSSISAENVTDQRLNEELCGEMANAITKIASSAVRSIVNDVFDRFIDVSKVAM